MNQLFFLLGIARAHAIAATIVWVLAAVSPRVETLIVSIVYSVFTVLWYLAVIGEVLRPQVRLRGHDA
jgi:hypothetical protein